MAAVPSIGRASSIEGVAPAEAELTRALYEQYANQIFRYCLHQLGSREEAEDAVQSTFLNAFRGIKGGIVPELESAWLFKIAHNVCLSRRRSSWRRGRVESPADFEVVEELTPAPSRRADELIGLQDVLEEMPENQRRAILLREWQGLSYREIADELELTQAAVETLIFRARRTLASGLERPPERRRIARVADLGNLATALKSLLIGGSAAAKVAATVAVVSATTVAAAGPMQHHHEQQPPAPAPTSSTKPAAKPETHALLGTSASVVAPRVHAKPKAVAHVTHRSVHPPKPATHVRTVPPAAAPAVEPPAAPQQQVVDPSAQASARDDKRAAKAGKQAAKEQKKAAKAGRHSSSQPPAAPSDQPATQPASPSSGTNPAGREKENGRWARDPQTTAPSTPTITTPVITTPVTGPIEQVQPIVVPDGTSKNGK